MGESVTGLRLLAETLIDLGDRLFEMQSRDAIASPWERVARGVADGGELPAGEGAGVGLVWTHGRDVGGGGSVARLVFLWRQRRIEERVERDQMLALEIPPERVDPDLLRVELGPERTPDIGHHRRAIIDLDARRRDRRDFRHAADAIDVEECVQRIRLRPPQALERSLRLHAVQETPIQEIARRPPDLIRQERDGGSLARGADRLVFRARLASGLVARPLAAHDVRHVAGLERPLADEAVIELDDIAIRLTRVRGDTRDHGRNARDVLEPETRGLDGIGIADRLGLDARIGTADTIVF